jgi:4-amino-4-deoxy-L-arabinose transferase-like glycosyltransferase
VGETLDPATARTAKPGRWSGFALSLLLITAAGFLLRILRLDFQPLWWDEGYSVWFATHPVGQMVSLTSQDIHPPLYYLLLSGWIKLLGPGPVSLRWLSVIAGTLAIPLMYVAGRSLFHSPRAGVIASLLVVLNPLHVYYSQEVRMYGLVALWSLAATWAAWGVFSAGQRNPAPTRRTRVAFLAAYVAFATLALYTQYYAIFLPIGLTLYAVWRYRRAPLGLVEWLAAQLAVALLYLPWAIYAGLRLVTYVSQKVAQDADRPLGLPLYLARHLSAFAAGHLVGRAAAWWPLALLLLVPIVVGLVVRWRNPHPPTPSPMPGMGEGARQQSGRGGEGSPVSFLLTVLATILLLGWVISLRFPFFPERGERLLLLGLPHFILLAAAAADALWARSRIAGYVTLGLFVAVSAASLAGFYTVPRYADDDYRPLIAATVEQGLPGDTVFAVYPWQVGYWRSYAPESLTGGPVAVLSPSPEWNEASQGALDDALVAGRVWFPEHLALGGITEMQAEAYLKQQGVPFVNGWYGPNTRLSAWAGAPAGIAAPAASGDAALARFPAASGGELTVLAGSAPITPIPAANTVKPISLSWTADAPPAELAVSVRLVDDLGQIWTQHDYAPLGSLSAGTASADAGGWRATDSLGLLVPAGVPPGRYHVELVLRPTDSARPLDALAADGRSLGAAARLFDLDIDPADRELTPLRLPIAMRQSVDLGDGIRFLGYTMDDAPLTPGDTRKVNLFWQATGQPQADYTAFVQILSPDGSLLANWQAAPGAGYATTQWPPGTLIRTQASLRVPAEIADGRYPLIAGLFRTTDGMRLKADGKDHLALGTVTVVGREHVMTPPAAQHAQSETFGSLAELVGYDLSTEDIQAGGSLDVTLHWKALAASERPYTVFVHLLDEDGNIRGYGDGEPGNGAYPTTGWLAGEYIADMHTVTVQAGAPPGDYRLAVGFYDPTTGERLLTPDGADAVMLDTPTTVLAH